MCACFVVNTPFGGKVLSKYCIAGLTIEMSAPEWALHDHLRFFICDLADPDISCNVVFKKQSVIPEEEARLIVKTPGTSIYESDGSIYNISGDEMDIPSSFVVSEDWSDCTMYIDPEYNDPEDEDMVQCVREGILAALRDVMIAALAQKQGIIIHSTSIVWKDHGFLFSAPSQTGKTTHAHMWEQLYGTPILDGDATACRLVEGVPYVYGLPWCGTSGEFMNHSAPLGAIVFLQQAENNSIEKLDFREIFIRLYARCFLLPWNDKMADQFLNIVQEVAAHADCYLLNCLPNHEAVEMVKSCLEKI